MGRPAGEGPRALAISGRVSSSALPVNQLCGATALGLALEALVIWPHPGFLSLGLRQCCSLYHRCTLRLPSTSFWHSAHSSDLCPSLQKPPQCRPGKKNSHSSAGTRHEDPYRVPLSLRVLISETRKTGSSPLRNKTRQNDPGQRFSKQGPRTPGRL